MSDPTTQPTQSQPQNIGQLIAGAPDKIWKRVRDALKVQTREQAIQLVGQDQEAAAAARVILETAQEDLLTRQRTPAGGSLLTRSMQRRPAAQVLYGPPGGGITL